MGRGKTHPLRNFAYRNFKCSFILEILYVLCTDKQNALRRECTFKIEIVLEIGVAGVNIYLKITVLTLPDVLARLAQSVRP